MFVRSPHAFAAIRGIDASAARALPGVSGGADRRRHGRCRHRQRDPRQPGPERRRAGRAIPSGAGRRLRPPCRRGRGARRRRDRGDRARRRRACRGRLRAARSGHRCRGRRAAGRAATLARGAGQCRARLARVRRHRPRRGRGRLRRGRACRAGPARQPAHRHGADGAARRAGALRRRERPLHPVLRLAERLCAAAEPGALHGCCRPSASGS